MDLATLVIRIDASQVGPAQAALKGLGAEGVRVQTATGGATVGMGRLNNAILGLARQASGAHPVIARFTDVLFSMALGGAKMTAVLGGLAALALAYRALTKDAREAKERMQDALDTAREAQRLQILPRGGEAAVRAGLLRDELASIEARLARNLADPRRYSPISGPEFENERAKLVARQAELRGLIGVTGREAEDATIAALMGRARGAISPSVQQFADDLGRQIAETLREQARLQPSIDLQRQLNEFNAAAGGADIFDYLRGNDFGSANITGASRMSEERFNYLGYLKQVEEFNLQNLEGIEKELDLMQRRKLANDAFVMSLANVGRAYGGVADEVLSLASGTMAIANAGRMPGFGTDETATLTDKAMGYGSAALTGIGFGASTGNPVLGGLGGGLSGFAMTGNPAGAIVGALSGIVSGVFEAGRRAREAQRMWQMALDDFALMFDEVTPQMTLEREFKKLSGGFTPEQIRGIVAAADAGQFTGLTSAGVETLRRLLVEYEKNAVQANELAVAEKRLHDARRDVLQALNAPAGLNLAAYGYEASSSGGTVININVSGAGNPRDVATQVFEEARRLMRQGGGSPYLDVVR